MADGGTSSSNDDVILVAGAGGFIGGHLVRHFREEGIRVRAVDLKPIDEWYQRFDDVDNQRLDLSLKQACYAATRGVSQVYNLAADMGGMGFIENNKALCMLSVLINTHLLAAARDNGIERFLFTSSACVYPDYRQTDPTIPPLKEDDAYPAMAEDGYGWEKLFSERMCRHFKEDFGLETRIPRYHNVYGPEGTYDGGREKAPSAICRKVAQAVISGRHEIDIWGDGRQTRSFMYIDDCIFGTTMIMNGHFSEPINLGSSELVTITELVDIVEDIAGRKMERSYKLDAPQGVRGRNSDNLLIVREFGWEPSISLRSGLAITYRWVYDQLARTKSPAASYA